MSLEKNKALARRYQEEVWGKGNLALIDELLAADFVDHSLPAGMDPGFAGAKRAVKGAHDAFPDGQWTVEDLIAETESPKRSPDVSSADREPSSQSPVQRLPQPASPTPCTG